MAGEPALDRPAPVERRCQRSTSRMPRARSARHEGISSATRLPRGGSAARGKAKRRKSSVRVGGKWVYAVSDRRSSYRTSGLQSALSSKPPTGGQPKIGFGKGWDACDGSVARIELVQCVRAVGRWPAFGERPLWCSASTYPRLKCATRQRSRLAFRRTGLKARVAEERSDPDSAWSRRAKGEASKFV
jgi:hypothetical protein